MTAIRALGSNGAEVDLVLGPLVQRFEGPSLVAVAVDDPAAAGEPELGPVDDPHGPPVDHLDVGDPVLEFGRRARGPEVVRLGQMRVGINHAKAFKCQSQCSLPIRVPKYPTSKRGWDHMPVEQINGLGIAYEVIGQGQPWVITPGGRFSKDAPGVRELARALAATGKQVLIWDRPNTGASEVCFDGDSESVMQADALAGLLRALGMTPAVISGGSGWLARLVAGGGPASRRGACARRLVDQWRAVRVADARHALLRGFDRGGLAVRDGRGGGLAGMGRSLGAQSGQSGQVLGPGPPHLHRDPRAVDAGLLPSPGRAGSRPTRCRRAGDAASGPGVSQRRQ